MEILKWLFGVALIVCCQVTASNNTINICEDKNGWFVSCIQKLGSKKFVVCDKNNNVLYKVSCKEQGNVGSVYRGKRICPIIKNTKKGDNRFPFCMGNALENYDYISKWYNSINHDISQLVPTVIIPTNSYAKIAPVKSSNQTEKSKCVQKTTIPFLGGKESQKAYRIYEDGRCTLEYYSDGFCEKYTAFEVEDALYSVTKKVKTDRVFYTDLVFRNVDGHPFYRGDMQKNYEYFNLTFANFINNKEKWSDSNKKFTVKIIARDTNYIYQIIANSKESKYRVIDRNTIVDNKKTKGYSLVKSFIRDSDLWCKCFNKWK